MELCSAVYDNSKRLLSVAETAQFLNVSESWVRRHTTDFLPSVLGAYLNSTLSCFAGIFAVEREPEIAWNRKATPLCFKRK